MWASNSVNITGRYPRRGSRITVQIPPISSDCL